MIMMLKIIRTNANDEDFKSLIQLLDKELSEVNGDVQSFYDSFNKTNFIEHVLVAYTGDEPVGCGALKKYSSGMAEVKRMFVKPEFRRQQIAEHILTGLETWASESGFEELILETGKKQIQAVALYQKAGYRIIENYGQYIGVENSICMKKCLEKTV
jgi:GNAT superfamily N-acetyltransferase